MKYVKDPMYVEYTTKMHEEYRSKLKPVGFIAIDSGFINVNPNLGSLGLVTWSLGDTLMLTRTEFGPDWGLHILCAGQSQWEVAPIPFGDEERVLERLLGRISLRVPGSPPNSHSPTPDPYSACQHGDHLNSLAPARAAVKAAYTARQELRLAAKGVKLGRSSQRRRRPESLAEAAEILKPILKELLQLVEQIEKRSKL